VAGWAGSLIISIFKSDEMVVNSLVRSSKSIAGTPHDNTHRRGAQDDDEDEGPVTLAITRRAKAEKIQEFERWLDGIVHEAMKFDGHMGVSIIRPSEMSNPEYLIILRFDNFENLAKWEKSEIRNDWIEKGRDLIEGKTKMEKQIGLEFWFTPSSARLPSTADQHAPPRYKMAIVVIGIIFVLVSTLLPQVEQATLGLPGFLGTLVGVAIMVLLMTYVIMPSVTKLLRPWLVKKRLF
jgi:uncharacterized protein